MFFMAKLFFLKCFTNAFEPYNYTFIFALRKFEIYVIGVPILIYTDYNLLQNIVGCSPKLAMLIGWALSLQKFNIVTIIDRYID